MSDKLKIISIVVLSLLISLPAQAGNCIIVGAGSDFAQFIDKIFTWALRLGGLVVFAALIFGGFMYLTSGGNQGQISEGKKYMTGAIMGIVILLGSVIILNTINPQILKWEGVKAPPDNGVCFYNKGSSAATSVRCCYAENSKSMPEEFEAERLEFRSIRDDLTGVYLFASTSYRENCSYEYNERESYEASSSEVTLSTTPHSFYMDWNRPGVYLYQNSPNKNTFANKCNMSNFPESPYQHYQNRAKDLGKYKNKVKAVRFRNLGCEKKDGIYYPRVGYVAVLHERTNFKGMCSIVGVRSDFLFGKTTFCTARKVNDITVENLSGNPVYVVEDKASSITPLTYKFTGPETGKVTFYEGAYQKGPHFSIKPENFEESANYFWNSDVEYPIDSETFEGIEIKDENGNATTVERIRSIKIDGDYAVLVGKDSSFGSYSSGERSRFSFGVNCEVLTDDVNSFVGRHVVNYPSDPYINAIGIAPLKSPDK